MRKDRCRCAKNSRKCRPTHPTWGADQQAAKVKSAFQYRCINAPRRALFVFIKWEHIGGSDRLPALRSSSRLTPRRQDGPLLYGLLMSRSTKMLHGFRPSAPSPFRTLRTNIGIFLPWPKIRRRVVTRRGVVALARRLRALCQTFVGNAVRSAFGRKSHTNPQSL